MRVTRQGNRAILMAALERVIDEMDEDTRTRLEPLPILPAEDAAEVSRLSPGVDDGGAAEPSPLDVC
ncbi:MAG: hypothetical protein AAFX50_17735 [Acidobacteriota bacterium]